MLTIYLVSTCIRHDLHFFLKTLKILKFWIVINFWIGRETTTTSTPEVFKQGVYLENGRQQILAYLVQVSIWIYHGLSFLLPLSYFACYYRFVVLGLLFLITVIQLVVAEDGSGSSGAASSESIHAVLEESEVLKMLRDQVCVTWKISVHQQ